MSKLWIAYGCNPVNKKYETLLDLPTTNTSLESKKFNCTLNSAQSSFKVISTGNSLKLKARTSDSLFIQLRVTIIKHFFGFGRPVAQIPFNDGCYHWRFRPGQRPADNPQHRQRHNMQTQCNEESLKKRHGLNQKICDCFV